MYLRHTRPQTASTAPTGRTSLRISNGLETAFRHLRSGEAIGGRPDRGDRTERQGGMSCRRNFRIILSKTTKKTCSCYPPKVCGQVLIYSDDGAVARRPRAPVMGKHRVDERRATTEAVVVAAGTKPPRFVFGSAGLTSSLGAPPQLTASALPRALQLARSQRPRRREQRR